MKSTEVLVDVLEADHARARGTAKPRRPQRRPLAVSAWSRGNDLRRRSSRSMMAALGQHTARYRTAMTVKMVMWRKLVAARIWPSNISSRIVRIDNSDVSL